MYIRIYERVYNINAERSIFYYVRQAGRQACFNVNIPQIFLLCLIHDVFYSFTHGHTFVYKCK